MKPGYIPQDQRKKILLLCDDIRMTSGISTMAREIVIGTSHRYNWVNIGGAIQHPEKGKKLELHKDTNERAGIPDSSVIIYPTDGYGSPDLIRALMDIEKPDAIMFFTDPRYWVWLFQMEHEIRQKIPMIYLNIWDDLPYPMYNRGYYESCDALMAISKQTENLNRVVLKGRDENKIIKYIPHGINEEYFYPITPNRPEYPHLEEMKKQVFNGKEFDFVLLYNARNIRRKNVPDLMLAWKLFVDDLPEGQQGKCCLLLHTQAIDPNGTNLIAVGEMLYGNGNDKYNVIINESLMPVQTLNMLYNISDAIVLPSSNEGWGLSLTEAMMCGKPFIATVTGGMQDQMRFEDDKAKWIEFNEEFGSNHRGKYKKCGSWAFPVFPNSISLIGSVPTPYIFDDRADPADIADQIGNLHSTKVYTPERYQQIGKEAYEWVKSDESMMTAKNMCKNVIETIDETFENFVPRYKYELIEIEIPKNSKHYVKYPIPQ